MLTDGNLDLLISKVSVFQANKHKVCSKINFGNNFDENWKFRDIISSFPNINDNNPGKQEEIEFDKYYKIVKDYLETNNVEKKDLENGLINLASNGHYKIVELLLEKYKVSANCKDIVGSTPIMYAAMKGHIKTIEILGKYGAEINEKNNMGYNAIMLAAMENHADAMDKIISINPVYINATNDSGKTPLIMSVILENKKAVEKLISYNAKIDIQDKTGKTALMYAAGNLDKEMMIKLIKAGANTKIEDVLGRTADEIYQFTLKMLYIKIVCEGNKNFPIELVKRFYEILNKTQEGKLAGQNYLT